MAARQKLYAQAEQDMYKASLPKNLHLDWLNRNFFFTVSKPHIVSFF